MLEITTNESEAVAKIIVVGVGGRLKEYGDVEEVCDEYAEYVDFYNSLKKKEKKKLNDEKFESRIVQNPKIGFWEKLLDKMKR